jgi:hypothetical protein
MMFRLVGSYREVVQEQRETYSPTVSCWRIGADGSVRAPSIRILLGAFGHCDKSALSKDLVILGRVLLVERGRHSKLVLVLIDK